MVQLVLWKNNYTKQGFKFYKFGHGYGSRVKKNPGLILSSFPNRKYFTSLFRKIFIFYGLDKKQERDTVDAICNKTTVKHSGIDLEVQYLSEESTKILFARAAMGKPKLLIADEPTKGVDIGAKKSIYELIAKLSDVGESVLLVSSEIEEIIGMSNRVLVMSRGKIICSINWFRYK